MTSKTVVLDRNNNNYVYANSVSQEVSENGTLVVYSEKNSEKTVACFVPGFWVFMEQTEHEV